MLALTHHPITCTTGKEYEEKVGGVISMKAYVTNYEISRSVLNECYASKCVKYSMDVKFYETLSSDL
jgi:hypothetical protein